MSYDPDRDKVLLNQFVPVHIYLEMVEMAEKTQVSYVEIICQACTLLKNVLEENNKEIKFVLGTTQVELYKK